MFEIKGTPKAWRDTGVWYFVDIGENQATWREYVALQDKPDRTEQEQRRLGELDEIVDQLFRVLIVPYSWAEFQREEAAKRQKALDVRVNRRTDEVHFTGDPLSTAEKVVFDACSERVIGVMGAQITVDVLDANNEATGEQRRVEIKTGKELVRIIRDECDTEYKAILDDIYRAIKSRSHLSLGQKKTYPSLRAS